MNSPTSAKKRISPKTVIAGLAGAAVLALGVILISKPKASTQNTSFFETKRGDFLISVVEGGTLEAVNEMVIRSEVEGTSRIIYIVPEGTYVKKGDLLVELDSSAAQDAVNQQQINVEKADFAVIQAQQQLDIQKSVAESDNQAAELKVKFAALDLKKFKEGEAQQLIRNAQIEITNIVESLEIARERLEWTEKLYKDGFETKANLDKDRLTVSQAVLKKEQAEEELRMLAEFDNPKKAEQLTAALQEAEDNLKRIKLQGERRVDQFKADLQTQKRTHELSLAKLERDKKQLAATRIFAPQSGLVVYPSGGNRFSNESMIEEGAVVRNRQELIKLPDVSEMKLLVKIHESHINQIQRGQPAWVVLDSMPDQRFQGIVNRVAPLPDSQSRWGNPNLKVYATEIFVTDKLPDIKPGVSARAEVVVTNLANVLTVPIQAVTTRKGKQVVFLADAPQKPVPVSVGLYNTKFIEVTSGVKEGDQVLLAPPFDTDEKDLGGAIIADGDKAPIADTNRLSKVNMRGAGGGVEDGGLPRNGAGLPGNGPRVAEGVRPAMESPDGGNNGERRGGRNGGQNPEPGEPAFTAVDAQQQTIRAAEQRDRQNGEGREGRSGGGRQGGEGRPNFNREEMMKQFDTNGDGQLDETERAAMRERFGRGGGGGGRRQGSGQGQEGQAPSRPPVVQPQQAPPETQ